MNDINMNDKKYKALCIGSGSSKGYYFLGALHYLYHNHQSKMEDIQYYIGTSIGCLITTMLVIGYSPVELFSYACNFDIESAITKNISIKNILNTWGIIPQDDYRMYLNDLIMYKMKQLYPNFNKIPTYKELYELTGGKMLIGVTYQLQPTHSILYMSHKTTPDLNIIDAIIRSSCVPFMFEKCIQDDCVYIDGGIVDSSPLNYIINEISNEDLVLNLRLENISKIIKINTFFDYMKQILNVFWSIQVNQSLEHLNRCDDVELDTELSLFSIKTSQENRLKYFNSGKNQMKIFYFPKEKLD